MNGRVATNTLLTIALMSMAAAATAQSKEQITSRFNSADKNKDGKLSLDEATAGMPRVASRFSDIDQDKDGYVTLDNILTALAASK